MTRNEFVIKTAEMILSDWRKAIISDKSRSGCIDLPGDVCHISLRAFQLAEEIAADFYSE
jgi:hypothetical protein